MNRFANPVIIDRGLTASVYKVTDTQDNGNVKALKMYLPDASEDYYLNEAAIASQLDHENVVRHYPTLNFQNEQGRFLIMEYCGGGNLRQALFQNRVTAENRLPWLIDLITGLEYLHAKQLIHRDVNPRNILITNNRIKIGGLRLIKKAGVGANTFIGGGSFRYCSPEVARLSTRLEQIAQLNAEEQFQTTAADIWSFGCILYEMYRGEKAVTVRGELTILQRLVSADFQAPILNSGENELDDLFQRMLANEPNDRPAASEIRKVLVNLQAQQAQVLHAAQQPAQQQQE